MRLCDYLVDPIYSTASTEGPDVAHERFEGISSPSSASDAGISHVIGLSIEQFAPAVAALSDHEEMVLALVHPLVQVYTIPRTGQLAYVGHICNFRQKVTEFLSRLPVLPVDMPCVQVRPRKYKGRSPGKALFKVDVQKLRLAFAWLKQHNPYYYHVEWREDAAAAWEAEDVEIGVTREATELAGEGLAVSSVCFNQWMQWAQSEAMAGDAGYPIGKRLFAMLMDDAGAPEGDVDLWNLVRRMVAQVFDKNAYRMATSLPQDILLVALSARGVVELGLPQEQAPLDMLSALRSIEGAGDASPLELSMFCAELDAVMLELPQEEPEVVHTGSTAAMDVGDDVGLREGVVDPLA